jgi:glycosyltransferase involved in cell wall biosynthesis
MIYDMHSSLPQQLTNFNFTRSRFILGLFKRLEDLSIRQAEAIITICPDLAEYVLKEIDDPQRHFLIENSIFEPVRLRRARTTDGQPPPAELPFAIPAGARTIVYAGTLEAYQGIDILIEAFRSVSREEPSVFLVVVGGTPTQVEKYRAQAGPELRDRCVIFERVSQSVAKRLIAEAAVQTSPRSSGTNTPLKIYEQLASGVPLVATAIHSHTQVLSDAVAYLVKPEPQDMARGIREALAAGRENNPKTQAARRLYAEKYSRPVYEEKVRRLLDRIRACAE